MMVLSFLPMLAAFNEKIAKVSKYIFSQQVSKIMEGIGTHGAGTESMVIIGINFFAVCFVFYVLLQEIWFGISVVITEETLRAGCALHTAGRGLHAVPRQ